MLSMLLIFQIVLSILIVILVLLQKNASLGLGIYNGSNDGLFGAKGPASFLVKATIVVGFIFLINTIAMGYLYNKQNNSSITDLPVKTIVPKVAPQPAQTQNSSTAK